MEEAQPRVDIRPLTHVDGTSQQPYRREADVERQIFEALSMAPAELLERAKVTTRDSPPFLKEECLVYLVRTYNQSEAQKLRWLASDLSEQLLARCVRFIDGKLQSLGAFHQEEGRQAAIAKLFGKITNLDSDLGDFAQVRFWVFLAGIVSETFQSQLISRKKQQTEAKPAWVYGSEPASDASMSDEEMEPGVDSPLDAEMLTEELLENIPEHLRTALKMELAGWPIESKFEHEYTISRYFNKTPRTINNWLRAAKEALGTARQLDEA